MRRSTLFNSLSCKAPVKLVTTTLIGGDWLKVDILIVVWAAFGFKSVALRTANSISIYIDKKLALTNMYTHAQGPSQPMWWPHLNQIQLQTQPMAYNRKLLNNVSTRQTQNAQLSLTFAFWSVPNLVQLHPSTEKCPRQVHRHHESHHQTRWMEITACPCPNQQSVLSGHKQKARHVLWS